MKRVVTEIEDLYWNIFEAVTDGILITDLETGLVLCANSTAAGMHGYTRDEFGGLRLKNFIHPKSLSFFADYAGVIRQGNLFEMLAQHVRRDGALLSVEWRATQFMYQERLCALAILRDVSKRIQAEHQLQQRVGVRAQEQSTLLEISQTLASTLELQPGIILDQLGVLIKYTHASLFVLEDSTLVALAGRGTMLLEQSIPFRIPLNDPQIRDALFHDHRAIRIANIWSAEPSAKFFRTLFEQEAALLLDGVQSWMWLPLAAKNRMIGGIGIAAAEQNIFTPHHASLAMTIANQAAVTLVNAELYENAQTLAALQERQRLAQNLHDAVNQSLFSAGIIAEVLPRLWDRDQDAARRSLEDLRRLTRGAQAEMRALLVELRPDSLIDADLGDLLKLLGNAFTGRTNIPVSVTIHGEGSLPAAIQVAFYHLGQEALMNIAKHARASQVDMHLLHTAAGLDLHIRDNGCGFDASEILPSGHYGLGMMVERAEAAGAVLKVTSQIGSGTEVAIHWDRKETS